MARLGKLSHICTFGNDKSFGESSNFAFYCINSKDLTWKGINVISDAFQESGNFETGLSTNNS